MTFEKIFVSIASYRDKLCHTTIENLFKMARHPDRVFVGICQQNKHGDPDCLSKNLQHLKSHIRIMRIDFKKARGPTLARYYCSKLYKKEDYYLQIDSHCLFIKDWDVKIIDMINAVEKSGQSKKVVLSHYPPEYQEYDKKNGSNMVTTIVSPFFDDNDIISFKGAVFKTAGKLPKRNAFVAGGFFFARGQLVDEVPFDPFLPFLFTGEEILLSARFYTHGWDVFTPNENIVFHMYTRDGEPKFWNDHQLQHEDAQLKVKMLTGIVTQELDKIKDLGIRNSYGFYGLGTTRTLDDFYRFVGIDPVEKKIGKPLVEFYSACSSSQYPTGVLILWYVAMSILLLLVCAALVIFKAKLLK